MNVDVVLIIDSSGSMTTNDPGNKRLEAARAYLTSSLEDDFVGVVDFDSSVRLASPLLRLPENKAVLVDAINTINSSGGTNIGLGVQEGCNALINSTSENTIKAAILLTDGQGGFAGQDSCFSNRGWPIYTFGFGNANDSLLQQIASNTGGESARLPISDLVCEFQRVRSKIAGIEVGPCTNIQIDPGATVTFLAGIPSGQGQATFSTSWIGSDVVMTLIEPSGRVIDRNIVAPDVAHDNGPTFEVYTITNPQPGAWEINLFGADVPSNGEEVVFGITTLPARNKLPNVTAGPNQTAFKHNIVSLAPATFTDFDVQDTHTATIDWGDGSTFESGIVSESGGSGTVSSSHVYDNEGTFIVVVCVIDTVGGTDCDFFQVTVVSPVTIVPIDIKPGSDPNSINCANEKEVIPVAILTTDTFDATTVDHTTVTFEGASETHVDKKTGEPRRHEEDVDGDGDIDLVFHFRLGDTDLTCESTEGTLTGELFDGINIQGTDSVRMVGGLISEGLTDQHTIFLPTIIKDTP